jgi:nicotinamidase-related amidase
MMMTQTGYRLMRASLVLAGCLWLAACASPLGFFQSRSKATPFRDPNLSMQHARDAVVTGTSTKAEVMATLGRATEIPFDSGYEVWVYRTGSSASDTDGAELVILFAPSGVVKKTRLRPAYKGRGE